MRVPPEEVSRMLAQVASGELVPCATEPIYDCGEVLYKVGNWRVSIFMDGGGYDYVDSVVTPDGRRGAFNDWWPTGGDCNLPEYALTYEQQTAMQKAFEEAPRCQ